MKRKESVFRDIMDFAARNSCVVAGFNVFGLDDAKAVADAAESLNAPVILMINKPALSFMNDIKCWGDVMHAVAESVNVPVCVHLDHASDTQACLRAIDAGFDSVMFDGSQLPLEENIRQTRLVTEYAHRHGKLVEAEIGAVGYSDKTGGEYREKKTDPDEAEIFAKASGADWLAVSVGNVHRMETREAHIDFALLKQIEKRVSSPLVIHGSSGIAAEDVNGLLNTRVAKSNIGTTLRMAFGNTLREEFHKYPEAFDRCTLFREPSKNVYLAARDRMIHLGLENFMEKYSGA